MNISIIERAPTKASVRAAIADGLDAAAGEYPVHGHARAAALSTLDTYLALTRDPADNENIIVGVEGYLMGTPEDGFSHVRIGVNVRVITHTE